jgi:hypothetical protein
MKKTADYMDTETYEIQHPFNSGSKLFKLKLMFEMFLVRIFCIEGNSDSIAECHCHK